MKKITKQLLSSRLEDLFYSIGVKLVQNVYVTVEF